MTEIIESIQSTVKYAGAPGESYVPQDLADERETTQQSLRLVGSSDDDWSLFGRSVSETHLQVMASALALRREDLVSRLEAVEADQLMPKEAHSPLRDAITEIDRGFKAVWGHYGYSPWLQKLRERREMKLGLSYPRNVPIETIIQDGEGQTLEFIDSFPEQSHALAKEIAAFGTSNPGFILLGVNNNGVPVGLKNMRGNENRDRLRTRVEGVSSNGIIPSLPIRVRFEIVSRRTIAVIEVPKGPEPVYYTNSGVPYVRHGSLSRPALPQEVNERVRTYLERQTG